MRQKHISRYDLNLLPALDALLNERHVSRAADRVGLSQPAMSRTLARLRRQFSDELLVRGRGGYLLTPRAERIRSNLADAIAYVEQLFDTESFDAAASTQSFRIAMSDHTFSLFGPAVARTILTEAPRSTITFAPVDTQIFAEVDSGAVDLLLYGRGAPTGYLSQDLFIDHFVCVVDTNHPVAGRGTLTLAEYARWPHLAIDVGRAEVDGTLRAYGCRRHTAVTMPYHALAASVLPGTDLILTVPGRLADSLANSAKTRTLAAPRELGSLHFTAIWHPRLNNEPSHRWLRRIVLSIVSDPA